MIRTLPLYTAAEMRAADAGAIDELGIPGAVLMEQAGLAARRNAGLWPGRPLRRLFDLRAGRF